MANMYRCSVYLTKYRNDLMLSRRVSIPGW